MLDTLDRLVDQQITLGQKDPHAIADMLVDSMGDELVELMKPYMRDFLSGLARRRIGAQRRQAVAHISVKGLADPELKLKSMWVPSLEGIVYKRIADMTAEDFDLRAEYLERQAGAILVHAQWCRDTAAAIRSAGVRTAGALGVFPELGEVG